MGTGTDNCVKEDSGRMQTQEPEQGKTLRDGEDLPDVFVKKMGSGMEALVFYRRPIAIWSDATERVYLLFGWNAFQRTVRHCLEFTREKTGLHLACDEFRGTVREGRDVVDCSFIHTAEACEVQALLGLDAALREDVKIRGESAGRTSKRRTDGRRWIPLTRLLEEWLGDVCDDRSDALVSAGFSARAVNQLFIRAGYLDAARLPTERGARMGMRQVSWRKDNGNVRRYAVYDAKRSGRYRDLIYRLYTGCIEEPVERLDGEDSEQTTAVKGGAGAPEHPLACGGGAEGAMHAVADNAVGEGQYAA